MAIERIRRHPAGNITVVFTVVLAGCIITGLAIPDDFRFCTAPTSQSWLRTVPLLGILAIGVGLLMITGEFGPFRRRGVRLQRLGGGHALSRGVAAVAGDHHRSCSRRDHRLRQWSHRRSNGDTVVHRYSGEACWSCADLFGALNDSRPVSFYPGETFEAVLTGSLGLMKAQFLWFLFIGAVAFYFLHLHRYGNHLYAVGGKPAGRDGDKASTSTGPS